MTEEQKETIKLVTKPIWVPATLIYGTAKEISEDITKNLTKSLKDKDVTDLWFGFTMFSFITIIFLTMIVGIGTSFKMSFAIAFAILFPIYLALYYTREYLRR